MSSLAMSAIMVVGEASLSGRAWAVEASRTHPPKAMTAAFRRYFAITASKKSQKYHKCCLALTICITICTLFQVKNLELRKL